MISENTSIQGYGTWHRRASVVTQKNGKTKSLAICGLITGCAAGQISGLNNFSLDDELSLLEILKEIQADALTGNGYSATAPAVLIGTLGHVYWDKSEPVLLKVGFKLVSEYKNNHPSHRNMNPQHRQRMYIIDLGEVKL